MNAPKPRSPLGIFVLMMIVMAVLVGYGLHQQDVIARLQKSCPAVSR